MGLRIREMISEVLRAMLDIVNVVTGVRSLFFAPASVGQ